MTREELYKELRPLGAETLHALDWDDDEMLSFEITEAVDIVLRILAIAKDQKRISAENWNIAFHAVLDANDLTDDVLDEDEDAWAEDCDTIIDRLEAGELD